MAQSSTPTGAPTAPGHRFELVSMPHVRYDDAVAFQGTVTVNYDLHLIHFLRGAGAMRLGSRAVPIEAGRAFLIPPLAPFACDKRAGVALEMVNIHFHLDLDGVPLTVARQMPVTFPIPSPARTAGALRRWSRRWAKGDAFDRAGVAAEVHRHVIACVARHSVASGPARPTDPAMARLRAAIRARAPGPYDSRALAEQVHLSVSQMNRRFRAAYGMSVRTYYERHHLARIQTALRATDLPIKQIASRFGFRDPFYFSRYFRRWTGVSPTAFRRQHRL